MNCILSLPWHSNWMVHWTPISCSMEHQSAQRKPNILLLSKKLRMQSRKYIKQCSLCNWMKGTFFCRLYNFFEIFIMEHKGYPMEDIFCGLMWVQKQRNFLCNCIFYSFDGSRPFTYICHYKQARTISSSLGHGKVEYSIERKFHCCCWLPSFN